MYLYVCDTKPFKFLICRSHQEHSIGDYGIYRGIMVFNETLLNFKFTSKCIMLDSALNPVFHKEFIYSVFIGCQPARAA